MKLQTSRVLASGQTQEWGDEIDCTPEEAAALIAADQAVPVPGDERPPPPPGKGKR